MVDIIKNEQNEDRDLIDTVDLDQLVEGNSIFESKGISYLKVTHVGVVKKVPVPIRSSGVSEMIDEYEKSKKPQPPKKRELIRKDGDLGREMKLTKNEFAWVYDFTDEQYVSEMSKYTRDLGLRIVMMGLDFRIRDKEGNEVDDDEQKLNILKGWGLTAEHINQLVRDIQSLTQWQEDKETNFLGS